MFETVMAGARACTCLSGLRWQMTTKIPKGNASAEPSRPSARLT